MSEQRVKDLVPGRIDLLAVETVLRMVSDAETSSLRSWQFTDVWRRGPALSNLEMLDLNVLVATNWYRPITTVPSWGPLRGPFRMRKASILSR